MLTNINCQIYIEGCLIPFNTVTIQAQVNQASICTIDVAPSEFVRKLLPRSHILVLFLEDEIWRVLWDGELRGFGMAKSSQGVSMQITAIDQTNAFGFMTKNIIDQIGAQSSTYAVFHTGAEFKFAPAGGGTFFGDIRKKLEGNKTSLSKILIELIQSVFNNVPYFTYYNEKNKVLNRLISLDDAELSKLMSNNIASAYMQGIVKNLFSGNVSFDRVLNYFLEITGYCRVPLVGPRNYKGISPLCLLKPYGYFSTPPVSNCLFPDMYHTISGLGIDYLTEPTRIILQASEVPGKDGFTPLWFFNECDASVGPSSSSLASKTTDNLCHNYLSQDEINKGILSFDKSINFEKALMIKSDSEDWNTVKKSMQGFAYYEYVRAKYGHRTCSVSCIFHPFVICGFPGIIFEANQSMLGMVESFTHIISADGNASTTINFSHIHPADRSDTHSLYGAPIPKWVSKKYRPRNCDDTYKELFGANSSGHSAMGGDKIKDVKVKGDNTLNDEKYIYDNNQINIADIAATVFLIPKTAGEALFLTKEANPLYSGENANANFAYNYTRRDIISLSEYMNVMNLGGNKTDEELLVLPAMLAENVSMYLHPTKFAYSSNKYNVVGAEIPRRQNAAKQLQSDLLNVTGKLGK